MARVPAQGGAARRLQGPSRRGRRRAGTLAGVGVPVPHPGVRRALAQGKAQAGGDTQVDRARRLQRPRGGGEQQDQGRHQAGLRVPQHRQPDSARDAQVLGPQAGPAGQGGGVTPTHTNSRSLKKASHYPRDCRDWPDFFTLSGQLHIGVCHLPGLCYHVTLGDDGEVWASRCQRTRDGGHRLRAPSKAEARSSLHQPRPEHDEKGQSLFIISREAGGPTERGANKRACGGDNPSRQPRWYRGTIRPWAAARAARGRFFIEKG